EADDGQERIWDVNREMTTRIAWQPYMFDQGLPHLLPGLRMPTLVVSCGKDRIVPASCAERYAQSIRGSKVLDLPHASHQVDLEDPSALVGPTLEFLTPVVVGKA